jgi:hypothetical protein
MLLELFIVIMAIIVGEFTFFYSSYENIFTFINQTSNTTPTTKFKLLKLCFSSIGAMVPYGNPTQNDDNDVFDGPTTEVELTDAELQELLQIVFAEIGNSNVISVELLQSLGLYTDTVVSLLQAIGYIIF